MRSRLRLATAPIIAALVSSGCGAPNPSDTRVNARIKSPDGKLEAIYAEDLGGGAAVGATEKVFVVKSGAFPRLKERVFSEECVQNIGVAWEAPRNLRVSYDTAIDAREDPKLHKPSVFSMLSSGYWTFDHPHGTKVRLVRRVLPFQGGC